MRRAETARRSGLASRGSFAPWQRLKKRGQARRGAIGNAWSSSSVDLDVGVLDDFRPLRDFVFQELGEFGGGVADRLDAELRKALFDFRPAHGRAGLARQLVDDRFRRAGRCEQAYPRASDDLSAALRERR